MAFGESLANRQAVPDGSARAVLFDLERGHLGRGRMRLDLGAGFGPAQSHKHFIEGELRGSHGAPRPQAPGRNVLAADIERLARARGSSSLRKWRADVSKRRRAGLRSRLTIPIRAASSEELSC